MHMSLYLAFGILIKYFYPKAWQNNYVTGHQRKNGNIDMAICHVSKIEWSTTAVHTSICYWPKEGSKANWWTRMNNIILVTAERHISKYVKNTIFLSLQYFFTLGKFSKFLNNI